MHKAPKAQTLLDPGCGLSSTLVTAGQLSQDAALNQRSEFWPLAWCEPSLWPPSWCGH